MNRAQDPGSVAEWMRSVPLGAPIAFWGPRRVFEILTPSEVGLVAVMETTGPEHRPPMPSHPNLRTVSMTGYWGRQGCMDAP